MLIALDYDDTYTRDPLLWLHFIEMAKSHGHQIICVTMRTEGEGFSMCDLLKEAVTVVYTARKAKRAFTEELGFIVDVWIDDCPDFILGSACMDG